ncbi:MAG: hypothetical protein ABIW30_03055 [Arenimonas sp.]
MRRTLLVLGLALAMSAVQARDESHVGGGQSISHVNGGINADAGQRYGDLETVNGGISIGRGAVAEDVETVNGGVTLGDDVQISSAETVNGGVHAGQRVKVEHGAQTVNGGIHFGFNSHLGGDVETVNGGIVLQQTEVGGQLRTVSGDITVGARSLVHGGIRIEKSHGFSLSWGKPRVPRVIIGPNAVVQGNLIFEREVLLFVHASAKIGSVTGATAQPWTDTLPPR